MKFPQPSLSPRRWLDSLLAILAGNALYFLVLMPRVPRWLVHQPFRLDAGLLLDFLLCLAIYGLARSVGRSAGSAS